MEGVINRGRQLIGEGTGEGMWDRGSESVQAGQVCNIMYIIYYPMLHSSANICRSGVVTFMSLAESSM